MKIDRETISKVAGLAKIKVNPADENALIDDINKILTMMDKLNEIDTSNIEVFSHFSFDTNPLREDSSAIDEKIKEAALNNAPYSDKNYFIVPKVIKHNE